MVLYKRWNYTRILWAIPFLTTGTNQSEQATLSIVVFMWMHFAFGSATLLHLLEQYTQWIILAIIIST